MIRKPCCMFTDDWFRRVTGVIDWRTGFVRKPIRRSALRVTRSRRGPPRSARYLAWIRTKPCLICGAKSEAAHTGLDGGMAQKSSDFSALPICSRHHNWGHAGSFHELGRARFERRYGINLAAEVARLNNDWIRESETIAT